MPSAPLRLPTCRQRPAGGSSLHVAGTEVEGPVPVGVVVLSEHGDDAAIVVLRVDEQPPSRRAGGPVSPLATVDLRPVVFGDRPHALGDLLEVDVNTRARAVFRVDMPHPVAAMVTPVFTAPQIHQTAVTVAWGRASLILETTALATAVQEPAGIRSGTAWVGAACNTNAPVAISATVPHRADQPLRPKLGPTAGGARGGGGRTSSTMSDRHARTSYWHKGRSRRDRFPRVSRRRFGHCTVKSSRLHTERPLYEASEWCCLPGFQEPLLRQALWATAGRTT